MFMKQFITGHNRYMIFKYFPPYEGCYALCLLFSAVWQLLWYASSYLCIACAFDGRVKINHCQYQFVLILSFSGFGIVFNSLLHFEFCE